MKVFNYIYDKKFLFFLSISFLLYGNTLKNGYAIDDQFVTENNYTNNGLKSVKKIFTSYYAEKDGKNNYEYRPIVKLSFAIEHELFGVRLWVGHLINIILYALCLFLLFKVLRIIFYNYTLFFSVYITLIFAVLPIHTEVVASLKNRDILLCFSFCMLIIIQMDHFLKTTNYLRLITAALLCILSFLTKLDVIPFLAITPLVLYKKHKLKIKPILIIVSIFVIGFLISKVFKHQLLDKNFNERLYKFHENPIYFDHTGSLKISTALNSLGFYTKMLIIPTNMSCYYGYNTIDIYSLISVYALLGIVIMGLMVFYFFKFIKDESPVWYAIVFFGTAISMYLNIVRPVPGIVADRFVFSASIGFSILAGYLLLTYVNKSIKTESLKETNSNFKIATALILLIYSTVIITRNTQWKDRVTLYGCDIEKVPESAALNLLYSNEVLVNLNKPAFALNEQNKINYIKKATISLNNVLKIDSVNTTALNNLAYIKEKVYKDYAGAIPYYKKALRLDSTKFEIKFNLCYCLFKNYNFQEAQNLALKMFTDDPTNQQVLDLLSYILIENKKIPEGIQIYQALQAEQPNNNSINIILGNFYISSSDTVNARLYYSKALENDKSNASLIKIIARLSE